MLIRMIPKVRKLACSLSKRGLHRRKSGEVSFEVLGFVGENLLLFSHLSLLKN